VAGLVLGSLRVIGPRPVQIAIAWLVNYIRGTPPMIQIFLIFLALPRIGLTLNEYWTGVVALAVVAAGYEVEIVRAAIESIDRGQHDAARALGMQDAMTLRLITFPQAIRRMIPALTNELANVVKASGLLSVIAVNELMQVGNKIIFETFYFWEVIIQVAVMYLLIVRVLVGISGYLETRVFSFGAAVAEDIR